MKGKVEQRKSQKGSRPPLKGGKVVRSEVHGFDVFLFGGEKGDTQESERRSVEKELRMGQSARALTQHTSTSTPKAGRAEIQAARPQGHAIEPSLFELQRAVEGKRKGDRDLFEFSKTSQQSSKISNPEEELATVQTQVNCG